MKKALATLILTTIGLSTSATASVKVGPGIDQGFGVTAQYKNINAFVGIDGISADYIFVRGNFGDDIPVNWYVGGGAFIGWDNGNGVRAPLGLNMPFNSKWDAFVQVHPRIDFDHGKNSDTDFGVDASIGVRYQF